MYHSSKKISVLKPLLQQIAAWRLKDHKIVFTNGCFDILHPGHVEYLEKASGLGGKLIIGLNSDRSVHKLKGNGRPVQDEQSRARILAALQFVDAVIVFDEDTPENLIHEIRPEVLVKGSDYEKDKIAGADFVKSIGGDVKVIPLSEGYSTSGLIQNLRKTN